MADHTVEAVMSMPEDLFHNSKVGVITCTLVLTARVPHPKGKKTWLGYWRDDGFVKMKGRGRIDRHSQWEQRKSDWVQMFRNREVDGKMAVMREMTMDDEWCAEAFLTTDYGALSERDFATEVRKYFAFKILMEENVMEDEGEAVQAD